MRTLIALALGLGLAGGLAAQDAAPARVKVAASMPYLGEVLAAVGGDLVDVQVLTRPGDDPHYLEPTASQTRALGAARLYVENGMQLEGWSSRLVQNAGNPELAAGGRGHVYATNGVVALEVPTAVDQEAGGHLHLAGNPHVWLDPVNLKIAARNVETALVGLMPERAPEIALRRAAFEKRIDELLFGEELIKLLGSRRLEQLHRQRKLVALLESRSYKGRPLIERAGGLHGRARALRGLKLFTYHRTWSYLETAFGLEVVATVEEKPGIEPSPAHLRLLEEIAAREGVRIVAAPPYYPSRRVEGVARRIGGVARVLPSQPGEAEGADDLVAMYERIFDALESAAKETGFVAKAPAGAEGR